MTYAARLVAMTRPAAAPRRGLHEVVETREVRTSTPAPPQAAQEQEPVSGAGERAATPAAPTRADVDRRSAELADDLEVVSHVAEPAHRLAPSPAPTIAPTIATPRARLGERAHDWLAEQPDAADPLETVEASDEVRELLRAVRQWTSAPPQIPKASAPAQEQDIVEIVAREVPRVAPTPPTAERAQPVVSRRDDPVQVSIGNVMITVEDAPASRTGQDAASRPAAEPASRLARHYLRGV